MRMSFQSWLRPLTILPLIAALTLAVYSFSLLADFRSMDDQQTIVENEQIRSFSHIPEIFTSSFFDMGTYYRPMVSLSNMINYRLAGGADAFAFNLTNVLLHILVAFSVFAMAFVLFRDVFTSFCVALLFAVHPVHWSAVTNVAGRAILLCTLFYVNAFLLFVLSVRAEGGRRAAFYFLSLFLFILALLSKETAAVLPGILAVYLLAFHEKIRQQPSKMLPWLTGFLVADAAYLVWRKILGIDHLYFWNSWQGFLSGTTTFLRSVGTYVRLFVLPVDLHFDRSRAYLQLFTSEFWITVAIFLILVAVLISWRRKVTPAIWFFLGWFFVGLISVSQIVPIVANSGYATTAEHFLYLPSIGVFAFLVIQTRQLLEKAREKGVVSGPVARTGVIGIYVFFMVITVQQSVYSMDEIAMFKRSLEFNPHNSRVRTSLALAFAKRGFFEESEEQFRKALEDEEVYVNARIGLGKALFDQGKYFEGIDEYEKVIRRWGPLPLAKRNLDASYRILGEKYLERINDAPDDPALHYILGVIYSRSGRIQESIGEYRKAVDLNPGDKNALFNLAASHAALGDVQEAIRYYEQLLGLPGEAGALDYQAYLLVSELYRKTGELATAAEYERKAGLMSEEFKEFKESYVATAGEE